MGFGGATQANPMLMFQSLLNTQAGQAQQQAANEEAGRIREQANIIADESERSAIQKERETRRFMGEQAESYLAGGVLLAGTPMAVLEETRQESQQEIDAIRSQGAARAKLLRLEADQSERGGLQSLLIKQSENTMAKFEDDQKQRAAKQKRRDELLSGGFSLVKKLFN